MKTIIAFFGFFLINLFAFLEVQGYYHDAIGIPTAKKIKALEEAIQANGTVNIESRIIGGAIATKHYPFFAGLIINIHGRSELIKSTCGSSLLSSNRLVTAAHCNFDGAQTASKFEVVLGSNLLYYGGERFFTNDVVVHPYYDNKLYTNDIAILKLQQNIVFTKTVNPIRLPNNVELAYTFAGDSAIAIGFGKTWHGDKQENRLKIVLRHVKLQVIDNAQCAAYRRQVTPNTICTSGIGRAGSVGTCHGDSGGPLFVYNEEPVLIGITSFGSIFCESGEPAAYTRVTSFVDFIKQHL